MHGRIDDRREGTPPKSQTSIIPPFSRLKMLFVGDVPLLYPEKNVARQVQVEAFLDLNDTLGSFSTTLVKDFYEKVKVKLEYLV